MTASDRVRLAIAASDKSRARIAKDAGFTRQAVYLFMAGKQVKASTLDKLAAVVGLAIEANPTLKMYSAAEPLPENMKLYAGDPMPLFPEEKKPGMGPRRHNA